MRIEKLRLRGFKGIHRGLGLDEIIIDFTGRDGLIAFAGMNGTGKSTIIENLSPFNELASRSGALFNHCYRRDSEKELSFSYNGDHYRTLLKIDSQSGKSEGYIWKNGESLVTGKIRDYAKYVKDLFGSSELFYNSVFCSQNATKLSDMTTSELKGLFAEFLRLDRLQEYEETAKQVVNVLSGKVSQIDANIEALNIHMGGVASIQDQIKDLTASLNDGKRELLAGQLKNGQIDRENLKAIAATNVVLQKQVDELCEALRDMEKNRDSEESENTERLNALRFQYQAIGGEIKELDALLTNEAEITAAGAKEQEINNKIELLTKNIDLTAAEIAEIQDTVNKIEARINEYKAKKKELQNDPEIVRLEHAIAQTAFAIKQHNAQLSSLEVRDKDCQSSTCSFIVAALKAKEELPKLESEAADLSRQKQDRAGQIERDIAEIEEQLSSDEYALKLSKDNLRGRQETNSEDRKVLATARMELIKVRELAAKLPEIAVAKSKKEDRTKALDENKQQGTALSDAWKARKQTLDDQIAKQQEKILTVQNQIKLGIDAELKAIEKEIATVENQIIENETAISQTNTKIAELQGQLSGMAEAERQLKAARESKEKVNQDISEWTYIKNACGKNGLQAMEIDGAAPLITSFANDLLGKAFGALYSVKLLTQDEEGKECLDIVSIGEDGEEILLDNLSGGQKVWLLMALRLAMTLLSKEKGGRNFETAFFDEMDGALDPENAINFINLYKSFMDIGKFSVIPFISHKPECRSMADHTLMFEKGKNPYWN